LRGKPLLVHFQGPSADESVSAGDASRWRRWARRRLERAVYSRASLVVTLTGAFRRLLVERYGVAPWNTAVLAPGVDLERFSEGDRTAARAHFGLAADVFVVCCTRRLVPRMGLDVLIDAWARAFGGNDRARLLIAGDGELREDLEREVVERSLDGAVTVLGSLSDEELLALYRAADVNVVPSVSFEGFGLVLLEAAACGTPSIVTRAGGLPQAIAGLRDNLIVPAADGGALAERLAHAARGELPSRGQTRGWAEGHGWDDVAAAHQMLFERAMSDDAKASRKLRVVYLDHTALLSGGELALLRLLGALSEVEAHVVLAEDGQLVDRLLQAGLSVEVLPLHACTRQLRKDRARAGRLPLRATLDTIAYSMRLARRLRQLRSDLVHANSLKSGIYGSIAARIAGVPIVWQLHDRIDSDCLPRHAVWLLRALTRYLSDVVTSNSDATSQTVSPRARSVLAPPVVGLAAPGPALLALDDPLVVGMIGRLAPWKGQDVFLRAFAQAFPRVDSGPSSSATRYSGTLRSRTAKACAASPRNSTSPTGWSSGATGRTSSGNCADWTFSCTHRSPPSPSVKVVVEGMSAQLPVVASRGSGPEEIIAHGVDGLLYSAGDVAALAHILAQLEAEPQLGAQLGGAAERREQDYSQGSVAEQILGAYEMARGGKA
jgi:glycosyltransferase involved in cell wall biosynthesis